MDGPRPVKSEEYRQAIGLLDEVFRLSRGLPATVLPEFPVALGRANARRMVVVSDGGAVVSHAAYLPQRHVTPRGDYSIGAVCGVATHPDFRGRGYAKAVLAHLHGMMIQEGLDAAGLWTGSPGLYRPMGYEHAGEEYAFELSARLFKAPAYAGKVRRFAEGDLEALRELHRSKPHHVARSSAEFDALLHCPKERILVAESGGRRAAYVVAGKGEDCAGLLVDWAGGTPGVLACIRQALEEEPGPLRLALSAADRELAGALTDMGFPMKPQTAAMVKLLDVRGLLARTCGGISCLQAGGRFVFSEPGGAEFATDDAAVAARVVFGPEKARELISAAPEPVLAACEAELPLPLHVPPLDHV